jgi:hypothetical protein
MLGVGIGLTGKAAGAARHGGDIFFAEDGATRPLFGGVQPPAIYDSVNNKTLFLYEAWSSLRDKREQRVVWYDHALGGFRGPAVITSNTLTDDAHGTPAAVLMDDGFVYVFSGAHGLSGMIVSRNVAVGDYHAWIDLTTLGTALTYSKPINIGGVMHFMGRGQQAGGENFPAVHYNTTALTAGVPTWSTRHTLIDLGADTRWYGYKNIAVSGKIHFVGHRADGADTSRQDIFYVVYDPVAQTLNPIAGGVDLDVSTVPADRTWMEANARIFTSSGANITGSPDFVIDSTGKVHLMFAAGSGDLGDMSHRYMSWTSGGGWTSPVVVTTGNRGTITRIVELGSDLYEYHFVNDTGESAGRPWGRETYRKSFDASGVFGTEELVLTAPGLPNIGYPNAVHNAHVNCRVVFCETVGPANDDDSNAGDLKLFAHGDNGLVRRSRGGYGFVNAEAAAYVARLSVAPTFDEKHQIDELFSVIKSIGISKFDCFYDLGNKTRADAKLNLLSSSFALSEVGTVTWIAGRGFKGDGSTGYLESGWSAITDAVAYQLSSMHIGAYNLNSAPSVTAFIGGTHTSQSTFNSWLSLTTSTNMAVRLNDGTSLNGTITNRLGHLGAARSGTTKRTVRNGASLSTATTATTGLPDRTFKVLGVTGSNFADHELMFAHWGANLTVAEWLELYQRGLRPLVLLRGL